MKKTRSLVPSGIVSKLAVSLIFSLALPLSATTHASESQQNAIAESSDRSTWLQVAARKARPGSGAYTRNDNNAEQQEAPEARTAKARPGSGARSRSKQTTSEAISNSGASFASDTGKKRNSARPGRARKTNNVVKPTYEKTSEESIAQTRRR